MARMSFVLIGDAALTRHCGDELLARGHGIAAVVSDDVLVASWADDHGLRLLGQDDDWSGQLAGLAVDWLISAGNLRLIPPAGLAVARLGAVNFHDGPLPGYAGLNAPVWALLNGERQHGIAWHLIAGGIDDGDILESRWFDLARDETAMTLNLRCLAVGVEGFVAVLDQLESGELHRRPQDPAGRRFHRGAERPQALAVLDPMRPMAEALRLVRALDHGGYWNPVAKAKLRFGERVVHVTQAWPEARQAAPGSVVAADAEGLVIGFADGALRLVGLTCAGGLPVDPTDLAGLRATGILPDENLLALAHAAARQEPQLRRALAELQPFDLPDVSVRTARSEHQALPLPPLPLAALALAALRLTGKTEADVALAAMGRAGFVSEWVPLRLAAGSTVAQAMAEAGQALTAVGKGPGFALDLPSRDPRLAGLRVPDVGLSDRVPVPGTAITLAPGVMHYDPARLDASAARALVQRLTFIAQALLANPDARLADLSRLTPSEERLVLGEAILAPALPDDRCLHHHIEAQVQRSPDAVALSCEGQELGYAALDARANQLAQVLVTLGAAPGVLIGLCIPRGLDMVVAVLAILKAGAAYVPMDPGYPAERIGFYVADSRCRLAVTCSATHDLLPGDLPKLNIDDDPRLAAAATTPPQVKVGGADLAYVIYTSGSTGKPKGVMVEHRNVTNLFAGLDARLGTTPGVWLAVTSLSFDISVLELFWTLSRGFKVVLLSEANRALVSSDRATVSRGMDFSLYFWGNDAAAGANKYQLLLDSARFADSHGFTAVWTPERHFHAFGGPYPNPAVTGAAVAAVTRNIAVRAGSCVAPLHHPLRIAEEWAVVDNLCGGRAGLALASGWHPDDFLLRPENAPPQNRRALFETAQVLRRLWRGEAVSFARPDGSLKPVVSQPRPLSKELPLWITTAGNPQTWVEAGRIGANLLTHLLGQSIEEVGEKIILYHQALRDGGRDPAQFTVTLMLHCYLADSRASARAVARGPMKAYLGAAASLIKSYAWAFPAFKRPAGSSKPADIDIAALTPDELDAILDHAFDRYFDEQGLFGTVEDAMARIDQLKAVGVGEVAALVDYGIAPDQVMAGLQPLARLAARCKATGDHSLVAEVLGHRVTHLQCTPSMLRLILADTQGRAALRQIETLLLGGETLSDALAAEAASATKALILNMYGPTEATVWSSCDAVEPGKPVTLGRPLAGQRLYVLDAARGLAAPGEVGEIWIGGGGVTRGYLRQERLTAERFVDATEILPKGAALPGARLYRTGDLGRLGADGRVAFLGRADEQIKLRGHRIEPGEIEATLAACPGVAQAVVLLREDLPGDARLVAYIVGSATEADLRRSVAVSLPEPLRPAHYLFLPHLPLTPNRKLDRRALLALPLFATPRPFGESGGLEARIAALWCRILGLDRIGRDDNFFAVGGHSLLAVQAHRVMRDDLPAPGLAITDLFRFPTIAGLAAHLGRQGPRPTDPPGLALADTAAISDRRRAMRLGRADG